MATTPPEPAPIGAADDEKVAAGSGVSAPTPAEGADADAGDGAGRQPGSPQG